MKPLSLVIALGLATAACSSATSPLEPLALSLNGTLTQAAPTQSVPLAGATITVQNGSRAGATFATAADGTFTITGLTGAFDFVARAAGHDDATFHVDDASGPVTRSFGLKPTMSTVTQTIGAFNAPRQPPMSFFRDVHHDGFITVSELYFYWVSSQFPNNPPTRTIEVWDGARLIASGTVNKQQYVGIDLQVRVTGGVRYEIRITGGDWSKVKIASPN